METKEKLSPFVIAQWGAMKVYQHRRNKLWKNYHIIVYTLYTVSLIRFKIERISLDTSHVFCNYDDEINVFSLKMNF